VTLAFCWLHWRRYFFEIDKRGPAPIAHEALERIATLYAIENRIRGRSAEERRAIRQTETKPLVENSGLGSRPRWPPARRTSPSRRRSATLPPLGRPRTFVPDRGLTNVQDV
jgi:hypothetical protein